VVFNITSVLRGKIYRFQPAYFIKVVEVYAYPESTLTCEMNGLEKEKARFPMYAIIRTGSKQYQVAAGDTLKVEKLQGKVGDTIELSDVLLVADGDNVTVGQPLVDGAKVTAKIVEHGRAKKILIFKKKKRKGYRVKNGHRQQYTALTIEEVAV